MSAASARAVIEEYWETLAARGDFGRFFTDDVVFTVEGTDQAASGAEASEGLIRFLHEQAFDARPVLRSLTAEEGRVAVEAEFVGRHVGEMAGVAATGRDVRVPYAVVYDLRGERICALRGYLSLERLMAQITDPAAEAAAVPGP